ncbi:hypothetical protein IWQ60_001459 [Tieghemiomyces parasiticus]|uniref:Uncharacterized protein n=1 Tax=Tieghemiomyces parasiticus TaxID=78921 RepID=A0A9W8E1W7_9FUNG|nr:hypothetical protein IWQ60_001459 [Tieghemiomyces parasiticus]
MLITRPATVLFALVASVAAMASATILQVSQPDVHSVALVRRSNGRRAAEAIIKFMASTVAVKEFFTICKDLDLEGVKNQSNALIQRYKTVCEAGQESKTPAANAEQKKNKTPAANAEQKKNKTPAANAEQHDCSIVPFIEGMTTDEMKMIHDAFAKQLKECQEKKQ